MSANVDVAPTNPNLTAPHENELVSKVQEKVSIKILKCTALYGSKNGHLSTNVRVEFGNSVVGESPKVENDASEGVTVYDYECLLNVMVADPVLLDDLVQTPLVVTVNEILPKDKRTKEEKTNVIGQACVDLLPLLQGKSRVSVTQQLHPVVNPSDSPPSNDQNPPHIEIGLSVDKQLIPEEQLSSCNLVKICVESLYSLPESWNPSTAPQFMYTMAMPMPVSSQKEVSVVVPNGVFRSPGEKEQNSQRRWCMAPTASGSSLYMENSSVLKSSYQEEDGDLKSGGDIPFRTEAESDKARVTWNAERRCFLSKAAAESFMKTVAKQRVWPIEVNRSMVLQGGKGKAKEEELVTSFHGVAYVDMAPLLYPGVKKIRGAYLVKPFSELDLTEKTGRKGTLMDDANKLITSTRSSSSIAHAKVPAGKGNKFDGKPKPSAAVLKPPESVPDTDGHETKRTEGQQYVDAKSYVMIEFELEAPLVPKREPEVLSKRISELIPPRPKFSKKEGGEKKTVKDFQDQIEVAANQLLEEFRKMFSSELGDTDETNMERRQREFLYHINSSGKYFALKEHLKYFVVKIVREKYKNTSPLTDRDELQSFLSELYKFLLNQMHVGLSKYLLTEETTEIPPAVRDADLLRFFAAEAEIMFNFELAAKYYQERISLSKKKPEYWLDYGCFCLLIDDTAKAAECFKEAVSLNQKFLPGLLMNGCMAVLENQHEKAELFFETATCCEPRSIIAWTLLGLYYAGVENNIMAERAFNEANRINEPGVTQSKSYVSCEVEKEPDQPHNEAAEQRPASVAGEVNDATNAPNQTQSLTASILTDNKMSGNKKSDSIYLQAARFLIDCKALQFAERALAHELLAAERGESAAYFYTLAQLQMINKEYDKAEESITSCLKLQHDNSDAWCLTGHLHFLVGKESEAKEAYERALSYCTDPKDTHALYLRLSSIYLNSDQFAKAKELYLKACAGNPSCISWLGAGITSFKLGELGEAELALNEANILDNHNHEVWAYLALVCVKQNRHLEAEQCYKYSIKTGLRDEVFIDEIKATMKMNGFDMSLIS